jgi:hypothetical protein
MQTMAMTIIYRIIYKIHYTINNFNTIKKIINFIDESF